MNMSNFGRGGIFFTHKSVITWSLILGFSVFFLRDY